MPACSLCKATFFFGIFALWGGYAGAPQHSSSEAWLSIRIPRIFGLAEYRTWPGRTVQTKRRDKSVIKLGATPSRSALEHGRTGSHEACPFPAMPTRGPLLPYPPCRTDMKRVPASPDRQKPDS